MSLQFSVPIRNARLDVVESTTGASPILKLRTGAPPATCATADSGTVVATMNLPSDWMSNASAGSKALLGTWQDLLADAAGTAGHFRIYDSTGTTCHIQGIVAITGTAGADLTLDNPVLAPNQRVDISSFAIAEPNG